LPVCERPFWPGASDLPEGDLKIARRFNAGFRFAIPQVPKGRLKSCFSNGNMNRRMTVERFHRPFGTYGMSHLNPAVNCRAIFKSPSGR